VTDVEFGARLLARAERAQLTLDPAALVQLTRYLELLRVWNGTINLTALPLAPTTNEAIDRLFIEPLAAARVLARLMAHHPESAAPAGLPRRGVDPPGASARQSLDTAERPARGDEQLAGRWFDLGSGGGSPAIPIKVTLPTLHLTMVESKSRKVAFLREVVRALALPNADVVNARFDELPDGLGRARVLTVRGVRLDLEFCGVAVRLLQDRGLLAAFQPAGMAPLLADFDVVVSEQLPIQSSSWLHVYSKRST
jgi:16S rRNA G527 N7-methylase RsmG